MTERLVWAVVGVGAPLAAAVLGLTVSSVEVAWAAYGVFWVGMLYGAWTIRINRRGRP